MRAYLICSRVLAGFFSTGEIPKELRYWYVCHQVLQIFDEPDAETRACFPAPRRGDLADNDVVHELGGLHHSTAATRNGDRCQRTCCALFTVSKYKKLRCRRETARCFVSLNISSSHLRSFEMSLLSRDVPISI